MACWLFFGFQTWILYKLAQPAVAAQHAETDKSFLSVFWSVMLASPVIAFLIATFRDSLAEIARNEATKIREMLAKQASRLALLAGASVMPVLLWLIYLNVVRWGLGCPAQDGGCGTVLGHVIPESWGVLSYLPALDIGLAGSVLLLLSLPINANAYSLHRLYRDRLEKAFIFDPDKKDPTDPNDRVTLPGGLKLSKLMPGLGRAEQTLAFHGPYPIFNTALNVQGSPAVNRRGRNADFFLFTPFCAGSPSTGYVRMAVLEAVEPTLDLAAVMAISGAAASSNMGANSIRPLSLTLALLNVRLGYWLRNPKWLIKGDARN